VKEYALAAYSHSDLPFEKLVEALRPKRSRSHAPIFQATLTFLNVPVESASMPGLSMRRIEAHTGSIGLDLMLFVVEHGPVLHATLQYSSELFERSTAERMTEHFVELLRSAVSDPSSRLSELPFMTRAERELALGEWNATARSFDTEPLLHRRVSELAAEDPHAIAALFSGTELSRYELNTRSNRLAHHLISLGIGYESIVGVCFDDGFEMLVAILAIWKAGAAYLPLDPRYPAARLAFLMEDSAVAVVVTRSDVAEVLPSSRSYAVLIDEHADAIASEPTSDPDVHVDPLNAAYIIYTSGSTGQPKGVVVSHHGLRNLVNAEKALLDLNERSRVLKFASLNFDASVWEIAGALNAGATLCLATREDLLPGPALAATVRENHVTHITLPPSVLASMGTDLSVGTVVTAGESCSSDIAERWRVGRRFVNAYGPTENAVCATAHEIDTAPRPSIGLPILNVRAYVVDRKFELVPTGVPGELLLGGDSLARGYWNRPDLTAERFVPNPFSPAAGERLYRTGDLVRRRTNGEIDFLGRLDEQIKIRGFRIEPGEVESALRSHPSVRDCAVRATDGDRPSLVAYVVPEAETQFDPVELRTYLLNRLPEQMAPSGFVALHAIPLTPSGKVDRKALPMLDESYSRSAAYEPPITPTEEILAAIWSQVLGAEKVGRNDNYFTIGGDSIRAVQVAAKAQERGLAVAVHDLFETPTIAALAKAVEHSEAAAPHENAPFCLISAEDRALVPPDIEDAFPLTPLQMGMAFHADYAAGTSVYHDVFTFHLRAAFDLDLFRKAYQQLIEAHPALRTRFDFVSFSEPLQLVEKHRGAEILVFDLRALEPDSQEQALTEWFDKEKHTPIDLTRESFRLVVHKRSEETFQFSVGLHHANSDGWSGATLLSEMFRCYEALLDGRPIDLPKPESNYRDFVVLTREAIEDEAANRYWREKLRDTSDSALVRWNSGELRAEAETTAYPIPLSKELSDALLNLARRLAVPVKSVLLAAHLKVMSLWDSKGDASTGLSTSGRPERADGERVIGLFLNTVPLRVEMRDEPWTDLILRVYAEERDMVPYRRFSLVEMQKLVNRAPLFEASFNFIHFHVVSAVRALRRIEVLQTRSFAATNIPLLTMFLMDPDGSQLRQSIFYSPSQFPREQISALAATYHAVLNELVDHSGANHLSAIWNQPELVQANRTYWDLNADRVHKVSLAPDYERIPNQALVYSRVEQELSNSAIAEDNSEAATLCFAAWIALLARYTGQELLTLLAERDGLVAPITCRVTSETTLRTLAQQLNAEFRLAGLHRALANGDSIEDVYGSLPIAFGVTDSGAELSIGMGTDNVWLRYNSSLYSQITASRILLHLVSIVDQMPRNMTLSIADLRFVSSSELSPRRRQSRNTLRQRNAAAAE
jgi:amino acid adenylation domain-containing protein